MGYNRPIEVQVDRLLPREVGAGDYNRIRHNKLEKFCKNSRMDDTTVAIVDRGLFVGVSWQQE